MIDDTCLYDTYDMLTLNNKPGKIDLLWQYQPIQKNRGDGQSQNTILFILDEEAFSQYNNISIANDIKQPTPNNHVVYYEPFSLLTLAIFFYFSEFHHLVVDLVNTVDDATLVPYS